MTDPSFILELYTIVHSARYKTRWSVLLVPESKYLESLSTISALSDVPFQGRTILWPDTRRKLTVVSDSDKPLKGDYDLFMAGWGTVKTGDKKIALWMDSAKNFVSSPSEMGLQ